MGAKLLVLSASVGAGHVRAAEAVELAIREVAPGAMVKNVDVMTLTNALFRRVYAKSYLDLVNKSPHVLGYFYDVMDQPSRSGKNRGDRLRLAVERLNLKPFTRFLESEKWDLVINTHFLPAEIIASLRKQDRLAVRQVTVTTDFETHRLWVNQPCDHYFTATEEGARYLCRWGVPTKDITTTGIPIHPVFRTPKDRAVCLTKHGLTGGRPVILQMAGGFGVGPIEKLYRALLDVEVPLEVMVVAGRNEELKTQLEAVPVPQKHHAKIFGFTKDIDELMASADLVMSKPGGLTTSETLARGAAMVIVNPTPGQEFRNSDFLLENGAAIKANNIATLAYKVTSLLREPGRLDQLKANALRLARPNAAFDVARRALALLAPAASNQV
ncbi:MAG TPA: glycosyltransferase [Gemmataceae bacterium]|nr:glycosyltransferase [Gemmataceae bacterium]